MGHHHDRHDATADLRLDGERHDAHVERADERTEDADEDAEDHGGDQARGQREGGNAEGPDVGGGEEHLALAADVAEPGQGECADQRADAEGRHQIAERVGPAVDHVLVEGGCQEGRREAEHERHDAHDEQAEDDAFAAHVAEALGDVLHHAGAALGSGVAGVVQHRRCRHGDEVHRRDDVEDEADAGGRGVVAAREPGDQQARQRRPGDAGERIGGAL